jgi:flagellin
MSVINTNTLSLVTQNNLTKSQGALNSAIERLSSGMRINSAKDDSAGQAIANRFTANIKGLSQAQRNANDGISLAQTTEGALNEVNTNLQRIRELTVQSANGSNSAADKVSIQSEITQRLKEIDRTSEQTDFNGVKVLGASTNLNIQVGAKDGEVIAIRLTKIDSASLDLASFNVSGSAQVGTAAVAASADYAAQVGTAAVAASADYAAQVGTAAVAASADYVAAGDNYAAASADYVAASADYVAGPPTTGTAQVGTAAVGSVGDNDYVAASGDYVAASADYVAGPPTTGTAQVGTAQVSSAQVGTAAVAASADYAAQVGTAAAAASADYAAQVGTAAVAASADYVAADPTSATLEPLKAIDAALKMVDDQRGSLGAVQNRFDSVIANLGTTVTNLSASRSRIEDADYATEVSNMTRAQILQQAGTSVLAKANSSTEGVMSLLR